ncbi:translation initiation factor IF-3, mitochondrial [Ambystoma mexicanum]|uniref:translation initiation factor IF-3, mitochondrial n=1 Tax=Ambystoma mexicanum TaxID=8296 RepID=UPI0037E8784A
MAAFCIHRCIWKTTQKESSYTLRYFSHWLAQTIRSRTLPQQRWTIFFGKIGHVNVHGNYLCTTAEDPEEETESKKNKLDPNARRTFGNIGRKIPHRIIHVIDDNRQDLGNMHRADVIRIMDERGLKLVPLRENAEPPVYRLMTGKQIHEEQLMLKEKNKASSKAGSTQVKELSFSACIAKHDLETKTKQIQQWIEKKHHVRITVQRGGSSDGTDKLAVLEQIIDTMPGRAVCVYKPKLIKDGKAGMCVLRPLSEKEVHEYKKNQQKVQDCSDISNQESGQTETLQPSAPPQR